jgi:hypothetical protein
VWQGRCWQLTVHGSDRQHIQLQQLNVSDCDAAPMFFWPLAEASVVTILYLHSSTARATLRSAAASHCKHTRVTDAGAVLHGSVCQVYSLLLCRITHAINLTHV